MTMAGGLSGFAHCGNYTWIGGSMTIARIAVDGSDDQRSASMPLPTADATSLEPPTVPLPGLDATEYRCWQDFSETATALFAVLNRQLVDAHGLTLWDVMLLRFLANSTDGSARMGEIAEVLAVIPSRVSQQIRRLEAQSLVRRCKSQQDRRVVLASITGAGQARLKPALATYATGVRVLYLNPLTRQQMTSLGDSCRRIDGPLRLQGAQAKPARN
ncbi:MarR family winged helix-turn-helix transcriptional regulator [Mycolicibacterium pulveris]|uniref:MarR family winged helix-turn-helix transcriptional regulator n=1 Tax=Mycolicibacterium pulveris TaxID=36813 RepID=UPI003CE73CFB